MSLPLSLSLSCFLPRPLLGITRHMALSAACPGLSPPSSASYRYGKRCSLASLLEPGSDSINKTITVKVYPFSRISRQTVRAHRFPTTPHLDLPRSFHCSQTPLLEHGLQCRNSLQSKLSFNLKHAVLLLGCFQVLKRKDFKTITLPSLGNYSVCFLVHVSESDSKVPPATPQATELPQGNT